MPKRVRSRIANPPPEPVFVPLPGSYKKTPPNATLIGPVAGNVVDEITVSVRRREQPVFDPDTTAPLVTREARAAYEQRYGGDPAEIEKVAAFYRACGLATTADAARREVMVKGTLDRIGKAFVVTFHEYQLPGGQRFRGRVGPAYVPEELSGIITGIFGLDERPVATTSYRVGSRVASTEIDPAKAAAFAGYTGADMAKYYRFPEGSTGKGQTIGLLELSGGYADAEAAAYFEAVGVTRDPANLIAVGPHQARKNPQADGEVLLDIEVAGAVAPDARIVVYFATANTGQEFLRLIHDAVHDATYSPSVISISWGGAEAGSAADQYYKRFNETLDTARHFGITVLASSGDNGSADYPLNDPRMPWDGRAHVDYPASDPFTLGCGGTFLQPSGDGTFSEVVWHPHPNEGTGGGVSRLFNLPDYQAAAGVPPAVNPPGPAWRGVPDISGNAAPESGYRILVNGQWYPDPKQGTGPIGGTSAVAPLWAGLIALLNEALGRPVGYLHPVLYRLAADSGALRDIVSGGNGDYDAGTGWDPCTGLGVPDGQKLLDALKNPPPAGPPAATANASAPPARPAPPSRAGASAGDGAALLREFFQTTRALASAFGQGTAAASPPQPSLRSAGVAVPSAQIVKRIISQLINGIASETNREIDKDDNPGDVMGDDALVSLINRLFFGGIDTFDTEDLSGNDTVENVAIAIAQHGGQPR